MNRFVKSTKGVISIFVALMMTGVLSLGTFVLEASRLQAARTQLGQVASSAASSMLSTYNLDLQERYGIFAIDSERANDNTCMDYIQFNSDLASDAFGNNVTRLYRVEDADMTAMYNLTYPHILKRQLLTAAKYKLPPEASGFNTYTASYVLDELQEKCIYISERMKELQETSKSGTVGDMDPQLRQALLALDKTFGSTKKYDEKFNVTISDASMEKLPSSTGTVESVVPAEDKLNANALVNDAISELGSDGSVLGSDASEVKLSDVSINLSVLNGAGDGYKAGWLSALTNASGLTLYTNDMPGQYKLLADTVNAAINILEGDRTGNLLLNSYISLMFSNRKNQAEQGTYPEAGTPVSNKNEMNFAQACGEYVFGGYAAETDNQQAAYNYMMALRLIGNLYAVLSQAENVNLSSNASILTYMAWAYYETCVDMQLLTQYDTQVPLTKDHLILELNRAGEIATAFAEGDADKALRTLGYYNDTLQCFVVNGIDQLNYTDTMSLSLWFVPNEQKILRVADLMQLEIRYKQCYVDGLPATFLMSQQNTYCRVECNARMNSILPILSIGGSDYSLQSLPLSTVKYSGY